MVEIIVNKFKLFIDKNLLKIAFVLSILLFIIITKYYVNFNTNNFFQLFINAFSLINPKSNSTVTIVIYLIFYILSYAFVFLSFNEIKFSIKHKVLFLVMLFIATPVINALIYSKYSTDPSGGLSLLVFFLLFFIWAIYIISKKYNISNSKLSLVILFLAYSLILTIYLFKEINISHLIGGFMGLLTGVLVLIIRNRLKWLVI